MTYQPVTYEEAQRLIQMAGRAYRGSHLIVPTEHMRGVQANCRETHGIEGDSYLCCGQRVSALIQHRGRDEGPYSMCLEHAAHNVSNRGADVVLWLGTDEEKALWIQSGRKLP